MTIESTQPIADTRAVLARPTRMARAKAVLRAEWNPGGVADLEIRRLLQEAEAEREPVLLEIRLRVARKPPEHRGGDAEPERLAEGRARDRGACLTRSH